MTTPLKRNWHTSLLIDMHLSTAYGSFGASIPWLKWEMLCYKVNPTLSCISVAVCPPSHTHPAGWQWEVPKALPGSPSCASRPERHTLPTVQDHLPSHMSQSPAGDTYTHIQSRHVHHSSLLGIGWRILYCMRTNETYMIPALSYLYSPKLF